MRDHAIIFVTQLLHTCTVLGERRVVLTLQCVALVKLVAGVFVKLGQ